jgi:lambda family phage portal protein
MAIRDWFGKKEPEKPRRKRAYAAANTGRLFADFPGSERSADSELYPAISRMRARTRDLARNNEYARRYLDLLKTNVIGERGFTLQSKAMDSVGRLDGSGNAALEAAWRAWGRLGNPTVDGRLSWLDAQKLAVEGLARDGEIFVVMHRGSGFHDSFALEFIEPDQIDEEKTERLNDGRQIRMGVEMDKFNRPIAYHVLANHPGDYDFATQVYSPKHRRIPADQMIHCFLPLRAGQTRGEPWMASALSSIKQLGALREAAIVNARIGASKMGFFTSQSGDQFVPDDEVDNIPIMEAEPGSFHQLPAGVQFSSFDPQYPSNEFDDFHKACLKAIASALGVSYTSLSNDLEATSYSSIRQGALEERDHYRSLQSFMLEHFIRPVFDHWLESAMEMDSFGIPLRQYERFRDSAEFRGRAWSWVDPQKEMNAALMGLKSGVLSLQDVASNYGKDVEELLSQIARDKSLMEQFGVQYALEPYGANTLPVEPDLTGGEDG